MVWEKQRWAYSHSKIQPGGGLDLVNADLKYNINTHVSPYLMRF
jgi:hypothetical protein